jgi:hypothetical protein
VLVLALAALLCWAYLAHGHPDDPGRLAVLRYGWLRWQLRFLVVAAVALVLLPLAVTFRRAATLRAASGIRQRLAAGAASVLPLLVAALVGAELLLAHTPANPAAPPHLALPPSAQLARLGALAGEGRTLGVGRALPPNVPTLYGLADPRQYNPMQPAAYAPLAAALGELQADELAAESAGARLAALLGVRALLVAPAEAGGRATVQPTDDALPLLWLPAASASWMGDPTRSLGWATASPDPRALSYVEGSPPAGEVPGEPSPTATSGAVDVPYRWRGSTRIGARVPLTAARLLATSVAQDGGWSVLADGVPVTTTRANGPFLAAWLPAATRRLELLYRPVGLLAGSLSAALAAAAALAWLASPGVALTPRRRRRYSDSMPHGAPSR